MGKIISLVFNVDPPPITILLLINLDNLGYNRFSYCYTTIIYIKVVVNQ